MASGRTHEIINLSALPFALYYLNPQDIYGFIGGYLVGTFFITPDNDLYHSRPNQRWKLLKVIWLPYTKIFSHRGISHIPVIGMATKILYLIVVLFVIFSVVFTALYFVQPQVISRIDITQQDIIKYLTHPFTISFFIGLFLSEIIHIATDLLYSMARRLRLIR